jgi:hypothetical protein
MVNRFFDKFDKLRFKFRVKCGCSGLIKTASYSKVHILAAGQEIITNELECSLPCTQKTSIGPYAEYVESSPHSCL